MLDKLNSALQTLATRANHENLFSDLSKWQSLVINRRRPVTHRAFIILDNGLRVCLHKFDPCAKEDAFFHPHPWPSAMIILDGCYKMWVGASSNLLTTLDRDSDSVVELLLEPGSRYSMTNPLGWHAVQPLTTCYSIMVNDVPWTQEEVHLHAPTTKGKDLDRMDEFQLRNHLSMFRWFLERSEPFKGSNGEHK